jgi:hypothetical protein
MAFYRDLTPYEYKPKPGQEAMLNVGWLAWGHAFNRGPVSDEFASTLQKLAESPVNLCRGFHICDLCRSRDDAPRGNGEVRVRVASGVIYAAPALIWHYVAEHQYLPPQEFIDAVLG